MMDEKEKNSTANVSENTGSKGKKKKNWSTGKKWGMTVAMAVVFGLVAGGVFCGVCAGGNYLSGRGGDETARIQQTSTVSGSSSESTDSSSGTESGGTVAEVAKSAMPSLVTISTMSEEEMQSFFGGTQQYEVQGAGSGVIVGENDTELLIATNNHVVEGADSLSVGFINEDTAEGQIKGTDPDNDLAVVAVKLSDISDDTMSQIKIITVGDSDDLQLGDQVVAIGNALGIGQSVTSGYVSALNRTVTLSDDSGNSMDSTGLIQTDAPINPGNSGGALLNMKGELIGINEAKSSMTSSGTTVDGIGFAIPIDKAEDSLQQLMNLPTREKVDNSEASYLGISGTSVSSEASQMYGMPEGVLVSDVVQGGPADQAGVKKGDVLTEFDGRTVSNMDQLKDTLQYYASGETVSIQVQRADAGEYKEVDLQITLGSAQAAENSNQ